MIYLAELKRITWNPGLMLRGAKELKGNKQDPTVIESLVLRAIIRGVATFVISSAVARHDYDVVYEGLSSRNHEELPPIEQRTANERWENISPRINELILRILGDLHTEKPDDYRDRHFGAQAACEQFLSAVEDAVTALGGVHSFTDLQSLSDNNIKMISLAAQWLEHQIARKNPGEDVPRALPER